MTNYYIYHVPGIKIGVTTNVPKRMRQQGFTEWEHLETHTDIYEVSDREQALQRQYGLPIDKTPYWKTVLSNQNPERCAKISATLTNMPRASHTKEVKQKIGKSIRSTTPELDAQVIADKLLGMSWRKLASKYNIGRGTVYRIIKNMNE